MAWVTWQQYRQAALIGLVVLAAVGVVLLGMGRQMSCDLQSSGLAACVVAGDHSGRCSAISGDFAQRYTAITLSILLGLTTIPLLLGMFMGAPLLAEELSHGTHRLAWTQSISRYRWVLVKLGLAASTVVLAQAMVIVLTWWWSRPLVQLFGGPFAVFDIQGITPIAYAVFAFVLGVTAGLLTLNTTLGMAITMAGFLPLRLIIGLLVRPYYLPPLQLTWDTRQLGSFSIHNGPDQYFFWGGANNLAIAFNGDWRFGAAFPGNLVTELYQPADRFWTFQAIEAGIFLMLAGVLTALMVWRISRVT